MNAESDLTNRYESLLTLTSAQFVALEAIDRGSTHAEAARLADVDRTTVSRWANHHPAFRAELNQRRLDRARKGQERVDEITASALEAIKAAVESGDQAAALQWVKVAGLPTVAEDLNRPLTGEALIERHRVSMRTPREVEMDRVLGLATKHDAEEDLLRRLGE